MVAPLDDVPVRDAKRPIILTITKPDIRKSNKRKPGSCAAAIALCRQLHVKEVRVFLSRTYVKHADHWARYMTPTALRTEIISFDRGASFSEGDYRLSVPTGTQALGAEHTQSRIKRGKRKMGRGLHFVAGVREHGPRGYKKLW